MFDFLMEKFGNGKGGAVARGAIEKTILASPMVKRIEREIEAEQTATRKRLLAELTVLDADESKVMSDFANKIRAFETEWKGRQAELKKFDNEWVSTVQHATGARHGFYDRRHRLLRQLAQLAPDQIEAAAVELESRWRAYSLEAAKNTMHDFDKFRDRDAEFRAVVREVRGLVTCPAELIAERLAALNKQADKLLAAEPPRVVPLKAAERNPLWASCSDPLRRIMSISGGN